MYKKFFSSSIKSLLRKENINEIKLNGSINNKSLSAPTSSVKGLEYLFHYEKERERGEEFFNSRFFIRHVGKYHIVKLEQREQGNVGFKYQSAELRGRLPIGKKFSVSAGATVIESPV